MTKTQLAAFRYLAKKRERRRVGRKRMIATVLCLSAYVLIAGVLG
jgi:hypothetical protein